MATMNFNRIKGLQKHYGLSEIQGQINKGLVWTLEGSDGRYASHLLDTGACMLPKVVKYGAYGNRVPSRDELKAGTKGTFKNSVEFWCNVEDGLIDFNE